MNNANLSAGKMVGVSKMEIATATPELPDMHKKAPNLDTSPTFNTSTLQVFAGELGAALAAREPVSEADALQLFHRMPRSFSIVEYARLIERYHGIGESAQKGGET